MPEITCIVCPMGCRISIQLEGEGLHITGQGCKRGELYARDELTTPKRMITGVVKITGRAQLLPVKTAAPIPKEKILAAMKEIQRIQVNPPIQIGQIVKENIVKPGIAILATGKAR
jgi:CxxC motif-containing protein